MVEQRWTFSTLWTSSIYTHFTWSNSVWMHSRQQCLDEPVLEVDPKAAMSSLISLSAWLYSIPLDLNSDVLWVDWCRVSQKKIEAKKKPLQLSPLYCPKSAWPYPNHVCPFLYQVSLSLNISLPRLPSRMHISPFPLSYCLNENIHMAHKKN